MNDYIKTVVKFGACAFIAVIAINCISLDVHLSSPKGLELNHGTSRYTLKVEHSGSVREDVSLSTPYGVTVR